MDGSDWGGKGGGSGRTTRTGGGGDGCSSRPEATRMFGYTSTSSYNSVGV